MVEEIKTKASSLDSDPVMASLKKSLDELEREKREAEMKWEEIQKQEKVGSLKAKYVFSNQF